VPTIEQIENVVLGGGEAGKYIAWELAKEGFLENRTGIGAERGWPPPTRAQFEREAGPNGALFVGSPETVAHKIARAARALSLSRVDLKFSNGPMPHDQLLRSIELYGTQVAPRVHELLASRKAA